MVILTQRAASRVRIFHLNTNSDGFLCNIPHGHVSLRTNTCISRNKLLIQATERKSRKIAYSQLFLLLLLLLIIIHSADITGGVPHHTQSGATTFDWHVWRLSPHQCLVARARRYATLNMNPFLSFSWTMCSCFLVYILCCVLTCVLCACCVLCAVCCVLCAVCCVFLLWCCSFMHFKCAYECLCVPHMHARPLLSGLSKYSDLSIAGCCFLPTRMLAEIWWFRAAAILRMGTPHARFSLDSLRNWLCVYMC